MSRTRDEAKLAWTQMLPLRRAGYHLMPLTARRTPWTDWGVTDYSDTDFISHLVRGGAVGVRLGPEHLVIDIDPRNGGDDAFVRLCIDLSLVLDGPEVPAVRSGGGGTHLFYRKPSDLRTRVTLPTLYGGIDFKRIGGYVVAAGSHHPSGGTYRWLRPMGPEGAPQAPQALIDLLVRPPSTEAKSGSVAPKHGDLSPDELELLLSVIDAADYGPGQHEEWLAISMACHEATGGTGFDQWLDWCSTDDRYSDVPTEALLARWNSFGDSGGVTRATLFKAVVEAGRSDVLRRIEARHAFDEDDLIDVGEPIDEESLYD